MCVYTYTYLPPTYLPTYLPTYTRTYMHTWCMLLLRSGEKRIYGLSTGNAAPRMQQA